jgi:penicillin-binding protein 2
MNVVSAIEQSCDVFFYNAGLTLGLDSMFTWSSRFGLGRATRVGNEALALSGTGRAKDLIRFNSELEGRIPSVEYVRANRQTTVEAESINASIGQGSFEVTAIQLARMVAALGNGGKVYQPQLVLEAANPFGIAVQKYKNQLETQFELSEKTREAVLKGMELVINGSLGTARLSKLPNVKWGGKTGTAQVVAMEVQKLRAKGFRDYEDHALFVGLAPMDHPKIAVAVIAEHGGHGSSAAAPVGKAIVKAFMDKITARESGQAVGEKKEDAHGAAPKQ